MASWSQVMLAAPELGAAVKERFNAHGLGLLATLRRDGSPRISGIEPLFAEGQLWLGMMPASRKALDLLRDSRFALHSATIDKEVANPDAKVTGLALPVEDEGAKAAFIEAFKAQTGYAPPPGPFHLFRADIREISTIHPEGDCLVIAWWQEGVGVKRRERR